MSLAIGICEKGASEEMVEIFTAMEEHYFGRGIIERQKMQHYLTQRVFSADSGTIVIRVEQDATVIGFACVSVLYPSPRYAGQMFIKELFIAESHRGQGAGKKLMQFIAQLAIERECHALDWMSEKNNPASKRFYQALGGEILEGMHHFRINGESLRQVAERD